MHFFIRGCDLDDSNSIRMLVHKLSCACGHAFRVMVLVQCLHRDKMFCDSYELWDILRTDENLPSGHLSQEAWASGFQLPILTLRSIIWFINTKTVLYYFINVIKLTSHSNTNLSVTVTESWQRHSSTPLRSTAVTTTEDLY